MKPAAVAYLLFAVLEAVSLLRYSDTPDWSSVAGVLYVVFLVSSAITGAATLWLSRDRVLDGPTP